ncbi:MAG TPA: hypothetical protein VNQ73_07375 [Ilumatobacter sp.]|nr:hypothetical protein [Ilumatobacter sp.]
MGDIVLTAIGLRPGEQVRFRRAAGKRREVGRVVRVEADGSITFFDIDGAARSQRPEALEVRRPGSRGRLVWHNVSDVALTWEQLAMF